jgi:serine/threonine-protein kinase
LHDFAGVVHGDISTENIILRPRPHELVLIDYGSSWHEARTLQRDAGDGRTAGYAAGELAGGDQAPDVRSDQFSATVVFYELLTGRLPYDGLGGLAGRRENIEEFSRAYVPPSRACRGPKELPAAAWERIDQVVAKGLALDPDQRYPTGVEWRDALDRIESILKRPSKLTGVTRGVVRLAERIIRGRGKRPPDGC